MRCTNRILLFAQDYSICVLLGCAILTLAVYRSTENEKSTNATKENSMKASELRIGNYIGGATVESVHEVAIKTFDLFDRHPNLFIPIPLTAEWLERFGFTKRVYISEEIEYKLPVSSGDSLCYLIGWVYKEEEVIIHLVYYDENSDQYDISMDIKHVHQLQNLYFALTGEELTIKEGATL